jgi:hypothetical protein
MAKSVYCFPFTKLAALVTTSIGSWLLLRLLLVLGALRSREMGNSLSSNDISEGELHQTPVGVEPLKENGSADFRLPHGTKGAEIVNEAQVSRGSREYLDVKEKELMKHYDFSIKALEEKMGVAHASFAALADATSNSGTTNSNVVNRDMLVAKFYNEEKSSFLTKEEIEKDFYEVFRSCHGPSSAKPLAWEEFSICIEEVGLSNWRVSAQGNENTVETVLRHLIKWIQITKIPLHNYELTASRGQSIAIELDASLPVGAEFLQLKNGAGLYIRRIVDPNSEFARAIGEGAKYHAIVDTLNGKPCVTVVRFKTVKEQTPISEKLRLVVKCLKSDDAKLLWTYAEGQESSDAFETKANSLPVAILPTDQSSPQKVTENRNVEKAEEHKEKVYDASDAETAKKAKRARELPTDTVLADGNDTDSTPMGIQKDDVPATEGTGLSDSSDEEAQPIKRNKVVRRPSKYTPTTEDGLKPLATAKTIRADKETTPLRDSEYQQPNEAPKADPVVADSPVHELHMDDASVNAEGADEATKNVALSSKIKEGLVGWTVFKQRIGKALNVEFKSAGFHINTAASTAWKQHKHRYSSACSDSCECSYDLPFLTETVVEEKLSKDPAWNNPLDLKAGDYPMGFTGNFAATFMRKLKEQYPSESSARHLDRLMSMWKIHQKSNKVGKRCHDNCKCVKLWDNTFRKGLFPTEGDDSMSRDSEVATIPKKRKILSDEGKPTDDVEKRQKLLEPAKDPGPRIGCKSTLMRQTSLTDSQSGKAAALQKNPRELENRAASVRKNDIPPLAMDRLCVQPQSDGSAPSERESYSIVFDCKSAMGFYCLTEKARGWYCKVLSVCPHPNARTDPRIQAETKILFAEVKGMEPKKVSNYVDLRESYLEARNVGEPLRVTFINTNVTDETMVRASRWVAREWTEEGQWQGKCQSGWDGGASLCQKQPLSNPKLDTFIKSVLPPVNESRVDNGALRKVRFASVHKCRTYETDSLPGKFVDERNNSQHKPDTAQRIAPKEKAPLKMKQSEYEAPDVSMLDIRQMSIGDLLRHLESGAMEDDEFVLWLEHVHKQNILKHEIHRKSAELQSAPQDKTLERRLRELNLMTKALKIVINADLSVKDTQSLEYWEKFQIIVIAIDGIELDDATPSTVVEVSVACSIAGHSERLPPLPNRPLSPHIVYDENGPSYNLNHNGMKTDDRFIEFRLHTRDQSDERNRPAFMGNFVVKLSQLSMRCAVDKMWQDVYFDAEPENDLLGVKICLRARRADAQEYIQGKYEEARNRLKTNVIDWITRLNDDLKLWNQDHADELNPIGGDLRLQGGSSVLQSAIYLKDKVSLSRLLDLGRGGVNETCLNSAYNLTLRLLSMDDAGRQDTEKSLDEMCAILCRLINKPEAEPGNIVGKPGIDHDALKLPGSAGDPSEQQRNGTSIEIPQRSRASMQSVSELHSDNGQASGTSAPVLCEQLPSLDHSDVLLVDVDRRCRGFERNHYCRNKACRFIHVHRLTSEDVSVYLRNVKKASRKISATILRLNNTAVIHKAHAGGEVWWTAGCRTPTDVFYAAGGPSQLSSNNVSWFRSEADAIEALSKLQVAALWARVNEVVPSSFQSSSSNRLAC